MMLLMGTGLLFLDKMILMTVPVGNGNLYGLFGLRSFVLPLVGGSVLIIDLPI